MTDFDVIVVGAGPAGASAAYFLAKAGAKVCLLDKAQFPRDKTCGDGLTVSSLAVLNRMGLGEWIDQYQTPDTVFISSPDYSAVRVNVPDDYGRGRVVPRIVLDDKLVRQALSLGVDFHAATVPTDFDGLGTKHVTLTLKETNVRRRFKLSSKMIIAADGAHGSFTKRLGLIKELPDLVAVRAYFEGIDTDQHVMEFHYDSLIMPGYAWIFPLLDGRANVGLGTYSRRTKRQEVNLKQALTQFLVSNPYAKKRLGNGCMVGDIMGFPIRSRMSSSTPYCDNVLVVGEAAGVVDPVTGDGISEALETGEAAAHVTMQALAANDFSSSQLAVYGNFLRRHYGLRHRSALLTRSTFAYHPLLNRVIRRAQRDPRFALDICRIVIGQKSCFTMLHPSNMLSLALG